MLGTLVVRSVVALMLAFGASVLLAAQALAGPEDDDADHPILMNARMAKELQSRATRLGVSASTADTVYVGYTPGKFNATNNYWSIWAGSDKFAVPAGPYYRPPAQGAMWDFEGPYLHGDSLQGWW